mmetsp:Transcript_27501/g.89585  ORF Transcript_27501/g.89585 Transcript_27501/m.89585 type:complete len:233 (+) Transcript_27501:291-989(+)
MPKGLQAPPGLRLLLHHLLLGLAGCEHGERRFWLLGELRHLLLQLAVLLQQGVPLPQSFPNVHLALALDKIRVPVLTNQVLCRPDLIGVELTARQLHFDERVVEEEGGYQSLAFPLELVPPELQDLQRRVHPNAISNEFKPSSTDPVGSKVQLEQRGVGSQRSAHARAPYIPYHAPVHIQRLQRGVLSQAQGEMLHNIRVQLDVADVEVPQVGAQRQLVGKDADPVVLKVVP